MHVLYVDYGNEEIVPPSHVLPLPFSFAYLPAQALALTIHDVALPPCTPCTTTVSSLCHWMGIVLAGIVIQASIISCGTENDVVADVCVPAEVLVSNESITLLQQAQLHLPKWLNLDNNTVHLGPLLCSFFSETYDIIETTNDFDNGASPMYAAVSVSIPEMMVSTHSLSSQASSINTSTFPLQCYESPLQVISLPTQTQPSTSLSKQSSTQLSYSAISLPNLHPTVSVNQFPPYGAVALNDSTSLTTLSFVTVPSTVVSSVNNDGGQVSHGIQNNTCTHLNDNSKCQKWPVSDLSDESLNLEATFPKFEETAEITPILGNTHSTNNITSEELPSKLVALETQDASSYSTLSSSLSNEDALIPPPPAFSNDSSYMSELVLDTTPHIDCISDPSDDVVVTSLPSSLQVASNSQELNAQKSSNISLDAQELSIKQESDSPEQSQITSTYEIDVTLNDKVVLSNDIVTETPPEQSSVNATSIQLLTEDRTVASPELTSPNLIAEVFFEKPLLSKVDQSLIEGTSLLNEAPRNANRPSFKQLSDLSYESEFMLQVCSVKSPSLFYVYTEHTVQMLHLLEQSLAEHYSDPAHRQSLSDLNVGDMCCVETLISDSTADTVMLLCRGVILSVLNEYNLCSVFCVDYGFVTQVLVKSIFILEVQFIDTPVQCLCCSLFGITPVIFRNEGTTSSPSELMPSQIPLPPSPLSSPKRNEIVPPLSLDNDNKISISVTTRTAATEEEHDQIEDNALREDEENNWSENAIDYFKSVVENKVLVGVVKDKQGMV